MGGARVRSGPAPQRGALRRERASDRAGWIHLPASGREGETPAWPLSRPNAFEVSQWAIEWRRPQAIMWERLGLEIQVAMYVRTLRKAMEPRSADAHTKSLNTMLNSLGLTAAALASFRWVIDEGTAAPAPRRAPTSTAKDRLAVIQGGADVRAS